MRFVIIRKAGANTEAGEMPTADLLEAMGAYNNQMIEAGVFRGGEGLKPTSMAVRLQISRDGRPPVVTDGPFAETKEVVAGFTIIETASKEEALEWARRWPKEDGPVELELRPVYELSDFPTPEDGKPESWRVMEQAFRNLEEKR